MQVTLKIFRYNPEDERKKHYEKFTLEAEPTDRVLDLLEQIKDEGLDQNLDRALQLLHRRGLLELSTSPVGVSSSGAAEETVIESAFVLIASLL